MGNVIVGIPPFTDPAASVLATSTNHPLFPGTNVADLYHPAIPWRSTSGVTQTIDFALASTLTNPALALGWVNVSEVNIYRSTDGSTWRKQSPNLLLQSHDPGVTPWTRTNFTVAASTIAGPSRHLPAPKLCTVSVTSGNVQQVVDLEQAIGGAPACIVLWAKAGTLTQIQIAQGANQATFSIGNEWTRIVYPIAAIDPTTTNTFTVLVRGLATGTFYWGGCQVTYNTQTSPATLYETGSKGVVVPINTQNGRRMLYADLIGFSGSYGRIQFPSQATDDGASYMSAGAAAWVGSPTQFHGEQSHPKQITISTAVAETAFESEDTEVAILGRPKVRPTFNSGLVSYYMQETIYRIARMAPGNIFVYFANDREPQGSGHLPDPSKVYFAKLAARTQINYSIPELIEISLEFAEVT